MVFVSTEISDTISLFLNILHKRIVVKRNILYKKILFFLHKSYTLVTITSSSTRNKEADDYVDVMTRKNIYKTRPRYKKKVFYKHGDCIYAKVFCLLSYQQQ